MARIAIIEKKEDLQPEHQRFMTRLRKAAA